MFNGVLENCILVFTELHTVIRKIRIIIIILYYSLKISIALKKLLCFCLIQNFSYFSSFKTSYLQNSINNQRYHYINSLTTKCFTRFERVFIQYLSITNKKYEWKKSIHFLKITLNKKVTINILKQQIGIQLTKHLLN